MNTSIHNHGTEDDGTPVAIVHAEITADSWRSATLAQRGVTPSHADFYVLAGHLVDTLRALSGLAVVVASQVATYGEGRVLRDDEPGNDPGARLDEAWSAVAQVSYRLGRAERSADRFWSAIGHIGVEDVTS